MADQDTHSNREGMILDISRKASDEFAGWTASLFWIVSRALMVSMGKRSLWGHRFNLNHFNQLLQQNVLVLTTDI